MQLGWWLAAACTADGPVTYVERTDDVGTVAVTLDWRAPDLSDRSPVVVFVHAGGWEWGHLYADGLLERLDEAAAEGFFGVTVNYRTTHVVRAGATRFPWPAQRDDVRCAVRWVRNEAPDLGADPDRIALVGYGAGGHIATMVALASDEPDPDCPWPGDAQPEAVVSRGGPADFVALWPETTSDGRRDIARLLGSSAQIRPPGEVLRDASPVHWVDPDDPPVLQLHGTADRVVPLANAERLHDALLNRGVDATLEPLEGVQRSFRSYGDASDVEWRWLRERLP